MFKLKPIALGLCCVSVLGGCASLQTSDKQSLNAVPVMGVTHGGASGPALYRLGHFYQSQSRYDEAISTYQKALIQEPRLAEAHNAIGVIYATQGKHVLAVDAFRSAMKLAPDIARFHNNLGYAYMLRGFDAEAIEAFERASTLDPANKKANENLRAMREKTGKPQPSLAHEPQESPRTSEAEMNPLQFEPQVIANDLGAMRLVEVNPNVYELRTPQPIAANFGVSAGLPISASLAIDEPSTEKPAVETLKAIGVEVSNGNGITGMAKRVARFFKSQGIATTRLTNQKPFDRPLTTIEYRDGYRDHARALNSKLPQAGKLAQVNDLRQGIAVRLVLGRDLSHHLTAFDADATFASSKPTR